MNIDWETIEFEFSDEFDLFYEIFKDYSSSYLGYLDEIQKGFSSGDFHKSMIAAHTLKGVVSNFYCDEIRNVAFEMEEACRNEKVENVPDLIVKYEELHKNLSEQLESFFKKKLGDEKAA